jgi:plasmid replication initiation protein
VTELVVKANALANAAYTLTVAEQKIILSAITQVRRDEAVTDEIMYSISANALADMGGFAAKHEYRSLKAATERFFNRYLTVHSEPNGGGRRVRKLRWIQTADYIEAQGRVEIRFSKDVLPYLNQLSSHFFEYRLQAVAGMTSSYGVRLYELLIQWRSIGEREIDINWLRQIWLLDDKYSSIRDLKKRVIEPAVADVNGHSDLWVRWGQRKTGRRVTHLQFQFGPKREKMAVKITNDQIADQARPGETWDQAKARLRG